MPNRPEELKKCELFARLRNKMEGIERFVLLSDEEEKQSMDCAIRDNLQKKTLKAQMTALVLEDAVREFKISASFARGVAKALENSPLADRRIALHVFDYVGEEEDPYEELEGKRRDQKIQTDVIEYLLHQFPLERGKTAMDIVWFNPYTKETYEDYMLGMHPHAFALEVGPLRSATAGPVVSAIPSIGYSEGEMATAATNSLKRKFDLGMQYSEGIDLLIVYAQDDLYCSPGQPDETVPHMRKFAAANEHGFSEIWYLHNAWSVLPQNVERPQLFPIYPWETEASSANSTSSI
jgi:hypothetical protein